LAGRVALEADEAGGQGVFAGLAGGGIGHRRAAVAADDGGAFGGGLSTVDPGAGDPAVALALEPGALGEGAQVGEARIDGPGLRAVGVPAHAAAAPVPDVLAIDAGHQLVVAASPGRREPPAVGGAAHTARLWHRHRAARRAVGAAV